MFVNTGMNHLNILLNFLFIYDCRTAIIGGRSSDSSYDTGGKCEGGRKLDAFAREYKKVQSGELRPFQLMKQLGMSKTTFYRYLNKINSKE
ncbi:MAG: hypothetical protein SPF70_11150 [Lachnospiraceae bacterium]|nr:hypothetical protein [Lachnospiraceae bacterium]